MYVVRHDTTKEILAIRIREDDAYDIRNAEEDWFDYEIGWVSTDADVLLSEIDRIGTACVIVKDYDTGEDILFTHNENNEIVGIEMFNGVVSIAVETIEANQFNDAIVVNGNITILTRGMEVL